MFKRILVAYDGFPKVWTWIMKRIASLSILFAALIDFALEGASFDLWIMTLAIVTLFWNLAGRALRSPVDSQKRPQCVRFQEIVWNVR
jgi:hypothetical protein